jgi:Flp pilus assembly protein TadD
MHPRPRLPTRFAVAVVAAWLGAGGAQADEAAEIRALLSRGEGAAALLRAERAAAAQPRDVALRFLHGVVQMDLQRDDAALAHFTAMTQDYPELPDPHNNIALLHARAGRLELARQALESALRNDPGHRTARTNLGEVHLMLAVQAWELATASGPVDVALLRRLEGVRALLAAAPAAGR